VALHDLDADDDRPLLTRIVAHLQRDDIDRPRRRARRAISRRRGVGRCPLDDPRRGGSSPPGDGDACTRTGGRHRDRRGDRLTEMRPYRACPGGSSGGHGRAGRVARRRVQGLLGALGSALAADAVTVWASRHADLRALATWKPSDTPAPSRLRMQVTSWPLRLGPAWRWSVAPVESTRVQFLRRRRPAQGARLPDTHAHGRPRRRRTAIRKRLPVSDTLTRVLESVGREVGAFFTVRPCQSDDTGLSAREVESSNSSPKDSPRPRSLRGWCSVGNDPQPRSKRTPSSASGTACPRSSRRCARD
jgi:hypothetical protein